MCWTHLLLLDNLRIKKNPFLNKFPNKIFGLLSGKKEIPKNKTIIPYLGKVYNNPAVGDYVFKVNNHKFINGYKSTSIGSL